MAKKLRLSPFLLVLLLVLISQGCKDSGDLDGINFTELLPTPPPANYTYYLPIVHANEKPTLQGLAKAYSPITGEQADSLGIKWFYDYGLKYPFPKLGNAEYVPFFWCDQYPALAYPAVYNYFDALAMLPDDYGGYLLILNEPDLRGGDTDGWQCDRTPRQGAYIYKAILRECPNCKIVGPAVSHIDYQQGWVWLRAFYIEIGKLGLRPPDIAAVHDYTGQNGLLIVDSLFNALKNFDGATNKVWITEFGTCNSDLAKTNIELYKQDDRVERYAWFTGKGYPSLPCLNLVGSDNRLSPVGDSYRSAAYP